MDEVSQIGEPPILEGKFSGLSLDFFWGLRGWAKPKIRSSIGFIFYYFYLFSGIILFSKVLLFGYFFFLGKRNRFLAFII